VGDSVRRMNRMNRARVGGHGHGHGEVRAAHRGDWGVEEAGSLNRKKRRSKTSYDGDGVGALLHNVSQDVVCIAQQVCLPFAGGGGASS
jgi:hypothetical protein